MNLIPVVSSVIESIGYEEPTCTLYIRFHSGGTYSYTAVPKTVYHSLMLAPSHGKYFHANIKGRYGDTKIG